MIREEVEFLMDILQDSRADARIIDRYYNLVYFIFNNVGLDWKGENLSIKNDDKVMSLLQALEPEKYAMALEKLRYIQKEEKNNTKDNNE